jgi:hypothetical protein
MNVFDLYKIRNKKKRNPCEYNSNFFFLTHVSITHIGIGILQVICKEMKFENTPLIYFK